MNCAGGSPGIRAYVDQPFSQLLIEVCVYDPLFSDFDKNQCQTKTPVRAVSKEDVRLSEYNNLIPEDWVQNGVPGLELEDEGSGNEEEPDEEVPLEENPLYVTQQDNLARWNRQNLTSYLYTLKTTVCSKCDKKDSMVVWWWIIRFPRHSILPAVRQWKRPCWQSKRRSISGLITSRAG